MQANDPMKFRQIIHEILERRSFAVVGASRDPEKYGYKVYRALLDAGYDAYPVNPNAPHIDGNEVYPLLDNVPGTPDCVVTIVQPELTYDVARRCGHLHIPYMWMQPGSETHEAVLEAQSQGVQAVYGGPCILVALATYGKSHGAGVETAPR